MDCSCFGFVNPNHKEIIFNGMYVLVEGSCQVGMEFFLNVSRNLFFNVPVATMFQTHLQFSAHKARTMVLCWKITVIQSLISVLL